MGGRSQVTRGVSFSKRASKNRNGELEQVETQSKALREFFGVEKGLFRNTWPSDHGNGGSGP